MRGIEGIFVFIQVFDANTENRYCLVDPNNSIVVRIHGFICAIQNYQHHKCYVSDAVHKFRGYGACYKHIPR